MNFINKCSKKELELIKMVGIMIENKDYTIEELNRYGHQIMEFIMSHSTKNEDIIRLNNEYNNILNKLIN